MERSRAQRTAGGGRSLWILIGRVALEGELTVPMGARGMVLFAHSTGSSRFSPRHQQVARALGDSGLATFLTDLLTEREEAADIQGAEYHLNIGMLAQRLIGTVDWLSQYTQTRKLAIGLFGAATGVAAALVTATARPETVHAIVSRSGFPELAGGILPAVKTPTLLIVGGKDEAIAASNRAAMDRLAGEKEMIVIPGATSAFEETGALEMVAKLAGSWFGRYLSNQATDRV